MNLPYTLVDVGMKPHYNARMSHPQFSSAGETIVVGQAGRYRITPLRDDKIWEKTSNARRTLRLASPTRGYRKKVVCVRMTEDRPEQRYNASPRRQTREQVERADSTSLLTMFAFFGNRSIARREQLAPQRSSFTVHSIHGHPSTRVHSGFHLTSRLNARFYRIASQFGIAKNRYVQVRHKEKPVHREEFFQVLHKTSLSM